MIISAKTQCDMCKVEASGVDPEGWSVINLEKDIVAFGFVWKHTNLCPECSARALQYIKTNGRIDTVHEITKIDYKPEYNIVDILVDILDTLNENLRNDTKL